MNFPLKKEDDYDRQSNTRRKESHNWHDIPLEEVARFGTEAGAACTDPFGLNRITGGCVTR